MPPSPRCGATHFSKYACTVSAPHLPEKPLLPGWFFAVVQLSSQVAMTSEVGGAVWEKIACKTFARVPLPHGPASCTSSHPKFAPPYP